MKFEELLSLVSSGDAPHLCADSRIVKKGDVFIAVKGTAYNGHKFIDRAVAGGAKYIVCEEPYCSNVADVIVVDDSAQAAGILAQAARGNPASKLINLAVTGTNGKTTVAFLVRSIVQAAGQKCGLVGTVVYDTGAGSFESSLTTPDCFAVAEMTEQMVNAGAKYLAIEASSHALSQNRLAGVDFRAAAFTNLTGDHLDYHKTEKDYLAAKARLFERLSGNATAVLNSQSPHSRELAEKTIAKILWYTVVDSTGPSTSLGTVSTSNRLPQDEPADITAHIESMDMNGTVFVLEYAGQKQEVRMHLLGRHNVSNSLAAAGLCLAAGFDLKTIAAGLAAVKNVPGRLEKVDWAGDFSVLVDYAHTDDALKNVLSTLAPLCKDRLIVVFGCGGDRDRTKRPRMAKVTERFADLIFVTSDNPRSEQPEFIIGEIMAGFENPTAEKISVESDRKKAIELALKTAHRGDIVLIAGKGHETYQIIGKQKFDFSDKAVALEFLKKRK